MTGSKRFKAFSEIVAIRSPSNEANMRHRVDELPRVFDSSLFHQMSPELPRKVELGINLQRLRDVDRAVRILRRVVRLAQGRMTGASVVPGVRAFFRRLLQRLNYLDGQTRIQFFEKCRQGCTHDAGANEHNIRAAGYLSLTSIHLNCSSLVKENEKMLQCVEIHNRPARASTGISTLRRRS